MEKTRISEIWKEIFQDAIFSAIRSKTQRKNRERIDKISQLLLEYNILCSVVGAVDTILDIEQQLIEVSRDYRDEADVSSLIDDVDINIGIDPIDIHPKNEYDECMSDVLSVKIDAQNGRYKQYQTFDTEGICSPLAYFGDFDFGVSGDLWGILFFEMVNRFVDICPIVALVFNDIGSQSFQRVNNGKGQYYYILKAFYEYKKEYVDCGSGRELLEGAIRIYNAICALSGAVSSSIMDVSWQYGVLSAGDKMKDILIGWRYGDIVADRSWFANNMDAWNSSSCLTPITSIFAKRNKMLDDKNMLKQNIPDRR